MAVKGAVLGDILGAQFEFDRPKNLDWKNVPLAEGDAIGFTDDTVMTLAIKKALKTGSDLVETMVEVGREYPFAGYGGRFLTGSMEIIMSLITAGAMAALCELLLWASSMRTTTRCRRWLKLQLWCRTTILRESREQL